MKYQTLFLILILSDVIQPYFYTDWLSKVVILERVRHLGLQQMMRHKPVAVVWDNDGKWYRDVVSRLPNGRYTIPMKRRNRY